MFPSMAIAAAGKPFEPPNIAGIVHWHRGDQNMAPSQWDNLVNPGTPASGNLTQPTPGLRPILLTNETVGSLTSQNALRFDGGTRFMSGDIGTTLTGIGHYFLVMYFENLLTARHYISEAVTGNANTIFTSAANVISHFGTNTANGITPPAATYLLFQSMFMNSTTAYQQLNNNAPVTGQNSGTVGMNRFLLGSNSAGGANPQFRIHEAVVYNAQIAGSNLTNLMTYFQNRYGFW